MASKPPSIRSSYGEPSERSPLLSRSESTSSSRQSSSLWSSPPRRWTRIALILLCSGIIAVMFVGYFVPAAAERYTQMGAIVDISRVSVDSFTDDYVNVAVTSAVRIDASRVDGLATRLIGRFGGRLVRKVHVDPSELHVYLPDYANKLLGDAKIPALAIDIRNGHRTVLNFIVKARPGPSETIIALLHDFTKGGLSAVKVRGEADLSLKAGLFGLGTQHMTKEMVLSDVPSLPKYKFGGIHLGEQKVGDRTIVQANATVSVDYHYPLQFEVPSLGFRASLSGCEKDSLLTMATATTPPLSVKPNSDIDVDMSATISSLIGGLTEACSGSDLSPLDSFIVKYLHGDVNTVFVSGESSLTGPDTPAWMKEFLQGITVAVPLPGHPFDDVVRSFNLSNVDIQLPELGADPDTPESMPRLSATIEVLVALPAEMQISLDVNQIRAKANVSYEAEPFGVLDMNEWTPAKSEKVEGGKYLRVEADVKEAPLNVMDYSIFQRIVQHLLFGDGGLELGIDGTADAGVSTGLGSFIVRQLPASGNITIDGFPDFGSMPLPKAKDISVGETSEDSIMLHVVASAQNPTPWTVNIPYCNLLVLHENKTLGSATVEDMRISNGDNDIKVKMLWNPQGDDAIRSGSALISDYISGNNATMMMRVHENSIPSMPELSKIFAGMEVTIPMPEIAGNDDPDDGDDNGDSPQPPPPHFITEATMHILSSTADFILMNPFRYDFITILRLNGSALYNGSTLGTMYFTNPFRVKPGKWGGTLTPRIPVDWTFDSVGYEAMKKALGGQLKIHPQADCKLVLGEYSMEVLYNATNPVGAHITL